MLSRWMLTLILICLHGYPGLVNSDMASKLRVCANLSFMFKEAEVFVDRYQLAAASGFKAVESDFPGTTTPEEIAAALQENNLDQILINSYHGDNGERGFAATPGASQQFRDSIEKTIPYLKAANCSKTHILSGNSLGLERYNEQVATLTANLIWAADRLAQENIVGLIEPINQVSAPGYFLSSYPTASAVIAAVNSENIRLQLDLFHLQMISGNIYNNINTYINQTGHVQVAQAPSRFQPNADGEVNYQFAFDTLISAGYDGFVGAEYNPSGLTTESLDWIDAYGLSY